MLRVLVADNSTEIVELLEEVLRNHGCSVDKAFDGGQAYEFLQAHRYDLVFLDHDMPEMTGLEVLKFVKIKFPATKVVMISGYPSMTDIFVKTIGADHYVGKPFSLEQILSIVRKYGPGEMAS